MVSSATRTVVRDLLIVSVLALLARVAAAALVAYAALHGSGLLRPGGEGAGHRATASTSRSSGASWRWEPPPGPRRAARSRQRSLDAADLPRGRRGSWSCWGPPGGRGRFPWSSSARSWCRSPTGLAGSCGRGGPWRWWPAILAIFAGPLLVMYPTIDNFAVFGASARCRSTPPARGPARRARGLAHGLRRVGGAGDPGPRRRASCSPWRPRPPGGLAAESVRASGAGGPPALAFLVVLAPWLCRDIATFGARLPHRRRPHPVDHQLQRAVLHWPPGGPGGLPGLGLGHIIGSKLGAWFEILGRTAVLMGGIFVFFFVPGCG